MKFVVYAALTATVVSATQGEGLRASRQLQDTDSFCTTCSVCAALGDLCNYNDLKGM